MVAAAKAQVDYTLYLVTDSTSAILGDKDIVTVVDNAIKGGVTIVQYRDKTSDTAILLRTATALHDVTKAHGIPLLINDRVDVALAVGCEGVHIGQDDMDLATARRLLGEEAIIGVTANSIEEALEAAQGGADYLGIGAVYATLTKENTKSIMGTHGVQRTLGSLHGNSYATTKSVCIGGVNSQNARRILYQSSHPSKPLDGVAIVSAIMGAKDSRAAAAEIRHRLAQPFPFSASPAASSTIGKQNTRDSILAAVPQIVHQLATAKPLCHNMTNLVVQNFAANVALAVGGSPIMSNQGREAPDLAKLDGSLVVNMGTVTPETLANYILALQAYNAAGAPVLFDPVGGGATAIRREAIKTLLSAGYFAVIKGNESEIQAVLGEESGAVQRGVDSSSSLGDFQKAEVVKRLAAREKNVVVMTGRTDYVSDGERVVAVGNGHRYLGEITGSGCSLGTTIAAVAAVHRQDMLHAAVAGLLVYEIAAERAAVRADVKGQGTFIAAFLDELAQIRDDASEGRHDWLRQARVNVI